MSYVSQVGSAFRNIFDRSRKHSKRIDDLEKRVSIAEQQIGQTQGGSAHSPGLNLDAPPVWLKITEFSEIGAAGRRLNIVPWGSLAYPDDGGPAPAYAAYAQHSVFVVDEDDEVPYLIETDASMPLVFIGARVLCMQTRLFSQGDYPAKALYRPIAGEVFGFYVQLGDGDGSHRYPWKQVWPISHLVEGHPDHYTDATVPEVGVPILGKAEPIERVTYDAAVTDRHRNYANQKMFLCRRDPASGRFQFNGFEEPVYESCTG